jgi:hypothetical protein
VRSEAGVDGVRFGLRCNTRRAGLRSAFANAHAPPGHGGVESTDFACATAPRGLHAFVAGRSRGTLLLSLSRTRKLMTLRNGSFAFSAIRERKRTTPSERCGLLTLIGSGQAAREKSTIPAFIGIPSVVGVAEPPGGGSFILAQIGPCLRIGSRLYRPV